MIELIVVPIFSFLFLLHMYNIIQYRVVITYTPPSGGPPSSIRHCPGILYEPPENMKVKRRNPKKPDINEKKIEKHKKAETKTEEMPKPENKSQEVKPAKKIERWVPLTVQTLVWSHQ